MSTLAFLTGLNPSDSNIMLYENLGKVTGVSGGFGLTMVSFYASQSGIDSTVCTIGGLLGLATVLYAGYRKD